MHPLTRYISSSRLFEQETISISFHRGAFLRLCWRAVQRRGGEGKPGGTKREGESLISAVSGRSENETRFVIVVVELRRRIASKWNDVADRFRGTEVSHDLREEGSSERWKYASVPSA